MYSFCDAIISGLAVLTLIAVIYLIRKAFKKHYLNIFSHMMLILIVFGLVSKLYFLPQLMRCEFSASNVLHDRLTNVPV